MGKADITIPLLPGEHWWGGAVAFGVDMPFTAASGSVEFSIDPNHTQNQAAPLLVSSSGRYVWSDNPFSFCLRAQTEAQGGPTATLGVSGHGEVIMSDGHGTLRGAYRAAQAKHFPASGVAPDLLLFSSPQYNTWIELMYDQEQTKILAYAEAIVTEGYPPGVLMIDCNWQEDYGDWEFSARRFSDPKGMVERLHALGFKVMLWTCPFVSPDSRTYRRLRNEGLLLRDADGKPAIREWWDGYSAVLDLTNPQAVAWYGAQNAALMERYGIDGFKLDAGDPAFYRSSDQAYIPGHANEHCQAFAAFGLRYPLNEYRACWKMAGQPLAQRLCDKTHSWDERGLASLIPNALAQGLLGYSFTCPDMIGGGEYLNFMANSASLDQELFVRYAQCSALFPMMQFSAAPWRVLDAGHSRLCLEAALLHERLGDTFVALAKVSAQTGEPILRHMAYDHPGAGLEAVKDQFMVGTDILVAPVVAKGANSRTVAFPAGRWRSSDGSEVIGPITSAVHAPLEVLPWYTRA